ncbi:hypothetical protein LCGC14_1838860 [marine sediment metagenome]|uniref:Uncharacterized protein n=1 Tax=marine sediment metagenome TaxID=412755 RepID=A0A0F9GDZ1_9ZZZZ
MSIWKHQVGSRPKVTVFERFVRGKHVLYLRWWDPEKKNWRHKSLSRGLRTGSGRIVETTAKWAIDQAQAKYDELSEPIGPPVTTESPGTTELQPETPSLPQTKRVRVHVRRRAP